jgi:hypothetical protein
MSLQITVDIIEDASYSSVYSSSGQLSERMTRIALVQGITTGSSSDAATALNRAVEAVKLKYPRGTRYSSTTRATAQGYEALGIQQDTDSVKVRIIYEILIADAQSTAGGRILFQLTDDTTTVANTTQFFRDDFKGTMTQLTILFADPADGVIKKQANAEATFESTKRRIIMSGLVPARSMAPFRTLINKVNSATWAGLPRAFWRLADFRSETQDIDANYNVLTYNVSAVFLADTAKDWSKYEVGRDPNTGQVFTVPPAISQALQKQPYRYGVIGLNKTDGILKIGPYGLADFTGPFGNPPP